MTNSRKRQKDSAPNKNVSSKNEDLPESGDIIGQITDGQSANAKEVEGSILETTRLLMREYGVRKSAAAIRDVVDKPHTIFSPAEAVSALSNSGFKASFGAISLNKITEQYFPLIAFQKDGSGILVKGLSEDGKFIISNPQTKSKIETVSKDTLEADYSGYLIIVKELTQ